MIDCEEGSPVLSDSEEEIILELQSSDVDTSSEDEFHEKKEIPENNTPVWKTVSNIANFIEGVGFLSLPYAVKRGGITTIAEFLLMPIVFCYSGKIMIECLYENDRRGKKVRVRSTFNELGEILSPLYGSLLAAAAQELEVFCISTSYVVICGSMLHHIFPFAPFGVTAWAFIVGAVVLPTTFVKSLSEIAWLSLVSVLALAGLVFVVVWYGLRNTNQWNAHSLLLWDNEGVILGLSIAAFAYSSFPILPSAEGSMADKSKFPTVLKIAYAISMVLKLLYSITAFLTFGFSTDEVVINNIPRGPARIAVSLFFGLNCLLSYPLPLNLIFERIQQAALIQDLSNRLPSFLIYIAIRVLVVLATVLLAVLVPHLALLISFIGSFTVSFAHFILPSLVHLKLKYNLINYLQVFADVLLALFGLIICVVGVGVSGKALLEALF